jgi:hypothetical protein
MDYEKDLPILLFSNKLDEALLTFNTHFPFLSKRIKTVDLNNPLQEVQLMARAEVIFCSNSALSYWASLIGKRVSYFPKPFYLGFWTWDKHFFGPWMHQLNQFRFMNLARIYFLVKRFITARGIYKAKFYRFFGLSKF